MHRILSLLLLLSLFLPLSARAEFKAGAFAANVSPPLGISIAGHMNDRKAMQIHDQLHARCLVLDDGATRLGIVLVDSCMLPRDLIESAKQQAEAAGALPAANILVAATHTHSGPCATPIFQSDPDPVYNAFLASRIADGLRCAVNNLLPAEIGHGAGAVPDEVFNRRYKMQPGTAGANPFGKTDEAVKFNPGNENPDMLEPAGPTDPTVSVLAVRRLDGTPIALLANYSLHYVGHDAGYVSADYFGYVARNLNHTLGVHGTDPPFVALMSNGTSGDCNNIDFRKPAVPGAPFEQMQRVAAKVAAEAERVYREMKFLPTASLAVLNQEIELGVRKPTAEEVTLAKAALEKAPDPRNLAGLPDIYARETVLLAEYPDKVVVPLQTLRIGDLAINAIPCEVFVEIGLALREASPFAQTFTIELANGYNGYLPTAQHHAWGGYETWRARSSYLETSAADTVTATLKEMLHALHQ